MLSTYRKALALLSRKEKRRGGLVLGMVIIMAVLETAGVASVMPFLSVLGNPEVVQTNPVLNTVYEGLGFTSVDAFILALVILLIVVDPWLALGVAVVIGGMYALIFWCRAWHPWPRGARPRQPLRPCVASSSLHWRL